MKYSELINFNPIESVVEIKAAGDKEKAIELVETYVMSDEMADKLNAGLLSQLQLDEVVDNKGVLLVGNYGTGKSHLMSLISAVVNNGDYVDSIRNKKFAQCIKPMAGRFEILRIELGAVDNNLRDIISKEIEEDLAKRGVEYKFPDSSTQTNNKKSLDEMMSVFEFKYPGKGYLIVIDELLDYLRTRKEQEIMLDLGFLREVGEFIKGSKLRLIAGVQEQLFNNPKFSFVADTMSKIQDRLEQVIIRKEDTAYVVTERILSKTPEQKAKIREHLLPFCPLYKEMSERLEDYVALYPIHPEYIEVFNKVHIVENRHVLKTISTTVRDLLDKEVPETAPGIISFDSYWKYVKDNYARKSDQEMKEVLDKSEILEDKIERSFPKEQYKSLALQIIRALSVNRLTTGGINVRLGMTSENLKDDLCLYIENLPEKSPDFLISIIDVVLKDILVLVSGQFIEYNKDNEQYFLDVRKDIDYDAKIEDKADLFQDENLNRYYYSIIYDLLDWSEDKAVPNYEIYEYQLNWDSHNIFRRGYLFLGVPGERSTAQPPRDYYMYVLPPYGNIKYDDEKKNDEVFFALKADEDFYQNLKLYAAAKELNLQASEQNTKKIYLDKSKRYERNIKKWLNENKNTCYDVTYKGTKKQLIELTQGKTRDANLKETIDIASAICFNEYFNQTYPDFPVFKTKVTKSNQAELILRAIKYFAGQKTKDSADFLDSFGLIKNGNIDIENSRYAMHLAKQMGKLNTQGVLNRTDIVHEKYDEVLDNQFLINNEYYIVVLLALVYTGHANLKLKDKTITASNMDMLANTHSTDIYDFRYLAKPKEAAVAELRILLEILELPTGMTANNKELEKGLDKIIAKTRDIAEEAIKYKTYMNHNPSLWGEVIIPEHIRKQYESKIDMVLSEFSNFNSRYNTTAKLNNLNLTMEQLKEIEEGIGYLKIISEHEKFKMNSDDLVTYMANIENSNIPEKMLEEIKQAKENFFNIRDQIRDSLAGETAARQLQNILKPIKENYIDYYYEKHSSSRLDNSGSKRKGKIMNSKTLSNLKRLTEINGIFQTNNLTQIERKLAGLQTCFQISTADLQISHICSKCKFTLSSGDPSVAGQLEFIEERLEKLEQDWTNLLLSALDDNLIMANKPLLKKEQQKVINRLLGEKKLPEVVDAFFIDTFNTLFEGLDKINIDMWGIVDVIQNLGPSTVSDLKNKLLTYIDEQVKGKDLNKTRIIITFDSEKKYEFMVAEDHDKLAEEN